MTQRIKKAQAKLKKLEEKKRQIDLQYSLERARLKEYERKERTRKLIEIGGLAEIAQISHFTKAELLGAMIEIAELLRDEPTLKMLRAKGEVVLVERTG
jgi:SepF-like predicted cell division protein (DUF552 family)